MNRRLIFSFAAISALVSLSVWGVLHLGSSNSFWSNLKGKIRSGQETVYFSELTEFKWDKVCVLDGYALGSGNRREEMIPRLIEGDLGSFRNRIPKMGDDGSWVFFFISNGVVVEMIERGNGYFVARDYTDNCIERDAARFLVNGKKILVNDSIGWSQK